MSSEPQASTVRLRDAAAAVAAFVQRAWTRAYAPLLASMMLTGVYRAMASADPSSSLALLALFPLSIAVSTMLTGALYRLGLEPDHPGDPDFRPGLAGIRWGALEWRVLWAGLLLGVLFAVMFIPVAIVWIIALLATGGGDALAAATAGRPQGLEMFVRLAQGPAGPVTIVVWGLGFLLLAYAYARLFLFPIFAAESGMFDLGGAARLTRRVWVIALLGLLAIEAVLYAASWLGGAAAGFILSQVGPLFGLPSGAAASWGGLAGQELRLVLAAPVGAGFAIYVYRTMRGDRTSVADNFS